jgi:hypothetical protein
MLGHVHLFLDRLQLIRFRQGVLRVLVGRAIVLGAGAQGL